MNQKWLVDEDAFMLSQKKRYSLARIKQDRYSSFDLLVATSWLLDEHDEQYDDESLTSFGRQVLQNPVEIIQSYNADELLKIQSQISAFNQTPASKNEKEFWKSCDELCKSSMEKLKFSSVSNVSEDIDNILKDKSVKELENLEADIRVNDTFSSDSEFWQTLLVELTFKKAVLKLTALFNKALESAPDIRQMTPVTQKPRSQSPSSQKPIIADDNTAIVPEVQMPNMRKGITPEYTAVAKMGFEWNRYNQAHYDQDNLPPLMEQGYTFEIHYEELAESTEIPTYKIIREKSIDNKDTSIILFRAPARYRDLAFRIVDKQWDRSSRFAGFTNKFENGVLELHFKFKKIRYRR